MSSRSNHTDDYWERTMRTLRGGEPPRVEVFVRSLAPPIGSQAAQEALVDRLHELERHDQLAEVEVTVWGDGICPDGCCAETTAGRKVLDRAMELKRWANDADADVELPFEETHVSSSVTNESFRKIVLPRVTIGVYGESGLEVVLPARINGEHVCVEDFLTALTTTETVEPGVETSA